MNTKSKTIILVGGGTGGHIVPIFELYKRIKSTNPSLRVVVVGDGGEIERNFYTGIPTYEKIVAGKLRRHMTLRNIGELIKFIIGLVQSFILLWREKPKIIFSKGGYVSLPVIFMARLFMIPCYVHESDTKMGIANKVGAKSAKVVFVAFPPETYSATLQGKIVFSGPIVREDIRKKIEVEHSYFGFPSQRPTIFITGGSQGAASLNKNVVSALPYLAESYNIIHQTGEHSIDWVNSSKNSLSSDLSSRYFTTDFLRIEGGRDRMLEAISAADLVIARAGVTTIAELASRGKAMILVPWKHAAADHQYQNAKLLEEAGGAILIKDDDLTPELIRRTVDDLLGNDGSKIKELGDNAMRFFPTDGLSVVSEAIIKATE